jgi:5-methyltetrahydropteroyltriglutamate--homocysteine methyltransferase
MPSPTVTVVGSYPRVPKAGGDFRLRKTLQAMDRGEASAEDVREAQDALVREVVAEQVAAGVELVTDGQIRWDDAQTRLSSGLDGFSIGGLERYFDNNTYYRQPEVKAKVSRPGPIVVDEFRFAAEASPVPVKAVLLGPYTFAALSKDEHYGDLGRLVMDLARALNEEARDLATAGAPVVAFDEPGLARGLGLSRPDPQLLSDAYGALLEGVDATTVLQTYFGDVTAFGPSLFELPFDVFGLDLVAGPANAELVEAFPDDRILQAGIVNGRNTKLEDVESIVARLHDVARSVDLERLWVSPSCGVEFLSREAAENKVIRLVEAAKEVRG